MPVGGVDGSRMDLHQRFIVLGSGFFYFRQFENIGWSVFRVYHCLHKFPPRSVWRGLARYAGLRQNWLIYAVAKLFLSLSLGPGVSGSERIAADGLNPLTVSQMPSDSSQKNSGVTATCHTPSPPGPVCQARKGSQRMG